MHPFIVSKKVFVVYLAVWILLGILLAAILSLTGDTEWQASIAFSVPVLLILGFMCLSAWYLTRYFPLRKTGALQMVGAVFVSALIVTSIWLFLATQWMTVIPSIVPGARIAEDATILNRMLFGAGFFLYLFMASVHYLLITYEASQKAERRLLEMQMQAREAELRALRSQINPHFLFNSLNSISALTTRDPESARKMTHSLAEFFRKSLAAGSQRTIPVSEEIGLIDHYLDIELIRYGTRLKVTKEIGPDCLGIHIPPLLLQPLIENAIKHGIAHLIDGGTITIRAACDRRNLTLSVENPCDPERPSGRGNRMGIENIRRRLKTVYDERARLDVADTGDLFKVRILIDHS
jgi:two-component system, LytTR family, sensor histidine kinase AlgZ